MTFFTTSKLCFLAEPPAALEFRARVGAWQAFSNAWWREISLFDFYISFFSKNYKSNKIHLFDVLHNLDDVLVMKNMIFSHALRLVLDTGSPDESVFQLLDDCPVNLVTEVLDGAVVSLQDHRRLVVWKLALILKGLLK